MTKYPKRTGFKLTYDAECMYNYWEDVGGCTCFRCAPCRSCAHEGHPVSLEENDEAWEIDEEVKDMSRSEIVDKGSSVGSKDQPFPIGSKVRRLYCGFQKLKEGGIYTVKGYSEFNHRNPHIFVEEHNIPAADCTKFELVQEDRPKEFKLGKWYKCVNHSCAVTENLWYRLINFGMKEGSLRLTLENRNGCGVLRDIYATLFDVNSESDCDPATLFEIGRYYKFTDIHVAHMTKGNYYLLESFSTDGKSLFGCKDDRGNFNFYSKGRFDVVDFKEKLDTEVKESRINNIVQVTIERDTLVEMCHQAWDLSQHKHIGNNATTNVGDINMSQVTRKVLNFKLIDADSALPVEFSLVHDFGDVVTEDDVETTKQQLLADNDLKKILEKHNTKRTTHINLDIQQKTGNTVKLLPITKVKELVWSVK